MITVYSDELAINFSNEKNNIHATMMNIKVDRKGDVAIVVDTIQNNGYDSDVNLYGYDPSLIFNDFCSNYKLIDAAGGVVFNHMSEHLLIRRFGIWDLPKGKVEAGETFEDAAIREVCEETGLKNVVINKSLPDTYHIYYAHKKWFLKKTYWFLMETSDTFNLVPETNEDITEAVWIDRTKVLHALKGSYRSLFDNLGYLFR